MIVSLASTSLNEPVTSRLKAWSTTAVCAAISTPTGASLTLVTLTVNESVEVLPAVSVKSKLTVKLVSSVSKSCAALSVNTPSVRVNNALSSPVPNTTVASSDVAILPTTVLFSAALNVSVVIAAALVSIDTLGVTPAAPLLPAASV